MESSSSIHFLTASLTVLLLTSYINSTSAAAGVTAGKTGIQFIKTSCSATTYPSLCFTSLSSQASTIQTSPKLLAHAALSVSLDTAQSTSNMMLKLSQTHGMSPREVSAMRDCVEELRNSVDLLSQSLGEMSQFKGSQNFGLMISDVQTWVSAALTNEDTCTDGFAGKAMNGNMKNVVRGRIVNVAHLTSNALALINSYASLNE